MRLRLVLLALLVPVTAHAQWVREAPVPTAQNVKGVAAPTPGHLVVVTDDNPFDADGAFHESTDGGQTWTTRTEPNSPGAGFNGVTFLDATHGWLYGNDNFRTVDGGQTWTELPSLGSTYHMAFVTPLLGIASGNGDGSLTRDGGLTWTPAPSGIRRLRMADASTGLGLSPEGLFRTTDAATTFTLVAPGAVSDAAFVTPAVAVAIVGGRLLRSVDGGQAWTDVAAAGPYTSLSVVGNAVLAWEETQFGTASGGPMARSADGGQSWTSLGDVTPDGFYAVTVVSASVAVALTPSGDLWRSGDAGLTWTQTYDSPGARPFSFGQLAPAFADAQTGVVGFGSGLILRTTDAGLTWTVVSSGSGQQLNDVARLADGLLVAVGAEGTALTRGADGRWTVRAVPNPAAPLQAAPLVAVQPTGGTTAAALDEAGRVYASADGGQTWSVRGAVSGMDGAADLHFVDATTGYVAGSGFAVSAVWRTADGGLTWTPVEHDGDQPGGTYVAVDAEGASAWAANIGGLVWRTSDGGATWAQSTLPDDQGFLSVGDLDFWDAATGYAVGNFGYAARTTDGGATWAVLPTPDPDLTLTDLYVVGADEVWASTRQGVVLYTATGGQSWAVMPTGAGGFGGYEAVAATVGGSAWAVGEAGEIRFFAGPPPPPVNRPPVAAFTFDATRLTVAFTHGSSDPDGQVVSYLWEFDVIGGGDTSTEPSPTYTFPEAGTYLVRLTVTDDDGATGVAGAAVVVSPGPGGTFGGFTEVTPFAQPFVTPQDEDLWIASAASADVDLDGDLDVVALGFYVVYNQSVDERLTLLRNDGPGAGDEWAFTAVELPVGSLTSGASDLAFGDYDGDGDPDLAIGSDGQTVLYRNDAGQLTPTDAALPGYLEDNDQADFDLRSITWADTDNDGDLDLLLPSVFDLDTFEFRTALMRNDGADGSGGWLFTEVESGLAPTRHAQSAWADDDGDGDLDLLLVHLAPLTDDGFIRRYRNDGGNAFTGEDLLDGLTVEHGEAQWGDADGDGDLDILVVGNVGFPDGTFGSAMRLYANDGGAYTSTDILDCGSFVCGDRWLDLYAATWADYDSDGDVDILLSGSVLGGEQIEGGAAVFLNDGEGDFVVAEGDLPAPMAGGTRGGTFSWMDLENDGDLDYFVAGEYFQPGGNGLIEAQIHAYRNDAIGGNAAPGAPRNLAATVGADGRVALGWTAPPDDSTPANALTYDLVVRRDGAPLALRLPEPGALGAVTGWTLAGLPTGQYTVALRAVDSAFNGGVAAEATFTVGTVGTEGEPTLATALADAAPNPTAGRTTIRFSLATPGHASVGVYDLLGRHVATLADGELAAGAHEVAWDARALAAGTYVVRLVANDAALVRRVTVVR